MSELFPKSTRKQPSRSFSKAEVQAVAEKCKQRNADRPDLINPYKSTIKPPKEHACKKCNDQEFTRGDLYPGHPDFGKPQPCECKAIEITRQRDQRLLKLSCIDAMPEYRNASFATFNHVHPEVKKAYQAAKAFADKPEGWLLMMGHNGCGKTHLSISIGRECLRRGETVLFQVVPDLLDYLRKTFDPNVEEQFDELFRQICEVQILILDDLGAQKRSHWADEKLFQLLNYRYNHHLVTIFTTNLAINEMEERISSRLSDERNNTILNMNNVEDYRRLVKKQHPPQAGKAGN